MFTYLIDIAHFGWLEDIRVWWFPWAFVEAGGRNLSLWGSFHSIPENSIFHAVSQPFHFNSAMFDVATQWLSESHLSLWSVSIALKVFFTQKRNDLYHTTIIKLMNIASNAKFEDLKTETSVSGQILRPNMIPKKTWLCSDIHCDVQLQL